MNVNLTDPTFHDEDKAREWLRDDHRSQLNLSA
jgi:hypothetical protein